MSTLQKVRLCGKLYPVNVAIIPGTDYDERLYILDEKGNQRLATLDEQRAMIVAIEFNELLHPGTA